MAGKAKDRTGQRYGRLVVLSLAPAVLKGARWRCVCDCGTLCVVRAQFLQAGWTQSCGCLRRENARARAAKARGKPRTKRVDAILNSFAALAECMP